MQTNKLFNVLCATAMIFSACVNNEQVSTEADASVSFLSVEQKDMAGIETGRLQLRLIADVISCTGEVEIPPQGMASVTAPLGGYIVDTDMVPGIFVKKGTVLAKLSNPEYIVLQQSYLETSGQLKFASQEFERQRLLDEQQATAVKKFQESESTFNVLTARLAGLGAQLKLVGINLAELEKGNIQSVISLRSPITGYVTNVNHHPGQFVEPREVIFEVVDIRDLHFQLNVFEQDITRVSKGQVVRFRPAGAKGESFTGSVSLVSPKKNDDARTFDIHGHIQTGEDKLKPGMYLEAEILVGDDSVYALPARAIVSENNRRFVITDSNGDYNIVAIETGEVMDGWVEILHPEVLRNSVVVTEGASRLFAALNRQAKD